MAWHPQAALAALVIAAATAAPAAAAEIPNPAVEGPIEGGLMGQPWNHALEPLSGDGFAYSEREFFFGGTATNLATGQSAPYRSRMLVRLPRDAKAFTGRVYVEWANVTSNYDLESRWPSAGGEFHMRRGNGAVVVSAQLVGHTSLRQWDPQRYGLLSHPGDDFSYDIFAQAIEALRDPAGNGAPGADPMSGLTARKIVAVGTSQSAGRLTTFINDGYNRGRVDLYALSRGGGPYEDFTTPIVDVREENNEIPQPDGPNFVGWEEAGSAHAPQHWFDYATALSERDLIVSPPLSNVAAACQPINRGTVHYTTRAMTHWIDRYLETGRMPPPAPRMERTASGALVRDEHGLAKGGLRHPFIQVPVAFNTGEQCPLFGKHAPWSDEKIRSLHRTHCEYVTKVRTWAEFEVERGWLLPADRDEVVAQAIAFGQPWPGESLDECAAARPAPPAPPAKPPGRCLAGPRWTVAISRRARGRRVRSTRLGGNAPAKLRRRGGRLYAVVDVRRLRGRTAVLRVTRRTTGGKLVRTRHSRRICG